jgi:hypothetical protein
MIGSAASQPVTSLARSLAQHRGAYEIQFKDYEQNRGAVFRAAGYRCRLLRQRSKYIVVS